MKNKEDVIVIIDCGHGGVDDKNHYTTAPNKMFTFNDGTIAYEGYYNRLIGSKLNTALRNTGIKSIYTVKPEDTRDISLYQRSQLENMLYDIGYHTIFISLHSNAGKGNGFEIFTSKENNDSDNLATYIGKSIMYMYPEIPFRKDYSDGDLDKEANFSVLRNAKGAAVLIENLFFDNRVDFEILRTERFQHCVATAIKDGIIQFINYEKPKQEF